MAANGWRQQVHWLTQNSNARARILCDQVAENTGSTQSRKLL
jgi:hypothetical protein